LRVKGFSPAEIYEEVLETEKWKKRRGLASVNLLPCHLCKFISR